MGPRKIQLRVFVAVGFLGIVLDQAIKWWAWRRINGVAINTGGYVLLGPTIRSWFAQPVLGAAADIVGIALLIVCSGTVLWRDRELPVLLGWSLLVAGFASNVLDRLGLHRWTAPGSERGVIDFQPVLGPAKYNVADLWIAVGAVLLGRATIRRQLARRRQR